MHKIEVRRIPKLAKSPYLVNPLALLSRLFGGILPFFQRLFGVQNQG
jgi:hypothetical protein